MKPYQILIFILSVLLLLFILSIFFPKDGIRLGHEVELRFVTLDEILEKDTIQYADISSILEYSGVLNDSVMEAEMTVGFDPDSIPRDTVRANRDSLRARIHSIEFAGNDPSILYPAFESMETALTTNKLVRILHYGDSQIEGDRITSFVRNRLQKQFGGSGVGLLPLVSLYGYQLSIRQEASDNWLRYTAFGNVDTTLDHNRYGPLASFVRFCPYPADSLIQDSVEYEAWVSWSRLKNTYRLAQTFREAHLYYSNNQEPFYIRIFGDDVLIDSAECATTEEPAVQRWQFEHSPENLKMHFRGRSSPDFYGIALDHSHGVAVDNIALRGSAGLVFTKMDAELLGSLYRNMNVKMIILQFGGNVVPYIEENYDYYERWFFEQLERIRQVAPGVPVVVIGVADMSVKERDKYITYPNLEDVRDALKSATLKAGFAYWDMYEAMGGNNSMPSWVHAQPSLATSDFVHFNHRGARVIAEMFYNALFFEYTRYKENKTQLAARDR